MYIPFNIAVGFGSGLVALVVGLATMLLVLWQAPRQRDNQFMALYMATVASWGLAVFLLCFAVVTRQNLDLFIDLLSLTVALNALATFALAARYTGLWDRADVPIIFLAGLALLIVVIPLLFNGQVIVLKAVTPDGRYIFDYTTLGVLLIGIVLLFHATALGSIWAHRRGRAGGLLLGSFLAATAVVVDVVPILSTYSTDALAAAVASILFARAILREQLFNPLLTLNAQLSESNAQLTELSTGLQRTADELQRAKDVAEAANRAKSTFLANMSHELRTPLTAILGYSDLLEYQLSRFGEVDLIADVQKIKIAGKHLLTLISEILDLSKIEAGKMELHLERFDLAELIREVSATIEPLAHQHGNRLTVSFDETIEMQTDKLKLRQVLFNIMGNACKFTERGTICMRVDFVRQAPRAMASDDSPPAATADRRLVAFTIADTGIGISSEQIDLLFHPFIQVDSSSTRRHGGSGLGLAISQRFCRMMGGDIEVRSALGQGSTFKITLPVDLSEAQRPQPA